jgi:hypothetical protein
VIGTIAELTKNKGIINNRRKKIDSLHDGKIVRKFVHAGVFAMFHADNQIGISNERQIPQCFLQVSRTYFTRSPSPVDCFREAFV